MGDFVFKGDFERQRFVGGILKIYEDEIVGAQ
jgi:hypothetical protein